VWLSLVYGFGGMLDDGEHLAFDPRLPSGWQRLAFSVARHGSRLHVEIHRFEVTYTHAYGDAPIPVHHLRTDEFVVLQPGDKRTCKLTD
jgi:alpha,alpha-trehalose phosphorylase